MTAECTGLQVNSSERLPTYVYGNTAFLLSTTFLSTAAKVQQERKLKGTKVVCGVNVPRVRKFHGTKVFGLCSPGANVPQNDSSMGAKVLSMDFLLPGTKVQRNEKARYRHNIVRIKGCRCCFL